jgi:hypothetical protein
MKDSTIDRGGMSEVTRTSAHALVSTVIFCHHSIYQRDSHDAVARAFHARD